MIARNPLQMLAFGALIALGAGSAAEARSHSGREVRPSSHQVAYNGRHGIAIAFSAGGHERVAYSRNAMYFGSGRHAGRFHFGGGETYAAESGHKRRRHPVRDLRARR